MKKCELYIMTASMLNIVAHGEVSQQIVYWMVKELQQLLDGLLFLHQAPSSSSSVGLKKYLSLFLFCALCYKLTMMMFTMSNIQLAFKFDAGATRHFLKRPSRMEK